MGIEEHLPGGFLLGSVEKLAGWGRSSSLWPATFIISMPQHARPT